MKESAHSLREQLKQEEKRARELESQKKKLESILQTRQKKLHRYEDILHNYRYNLEEAQKVIDAAEEEIKSILKRRQSHEKLLKACVQAYAQSARRTSTTNPTQRLRQQTIKRAAAKLSRDLFREMHAETPRLNELQTVIEERLAYQSRIVNEYMPADVQRLEQQEQTLTKTKSQVKVTEQEAQSASQKVNDLRKQLAETEKKLAEIRRQRMEEERKRREAAERKRQQQLAKKQAEAEQDFPYDESEIKPLSELETSMPSFTKQQGDLRWPAAGRIIRPYGEFTHPEFGVTMTSHGIDVQVTAGSTLQAVADGRIQYMGTLPSLGNTIIMDHGNDFMSIYSNIMPASHVKKGILVKGNQPLGTVIGSDSNGRSVYHFEVRKGLQALDPVKWLQSQ